MSQLMSPSHQSTVMAEKRLLVRYSHHIGTDAERCLWRFLLRKSKLGYKFFRSYPIADYFADFVCVPAKIVIELDGSQPLCEREYDTPRTRAIQALGYRILRFCDADVLRRTDTVLDVIGKELKARWTPPPFRIKARHSPPARNIPPGPT